MSRIRTLAPRLPLNPNNKFGYDMLSTIRGTTKQNFKCLMLTSPGERVMDPEFGVGLKQYLFENFSPELRVDLKTNIRQQTIPNKPDKSWTNPENKKKLKNPRGPPPPPPVLSPVLLETKKAAP